VFDVSEPTVRRETGELDATPDSNRSLRRRVRLAAGVALLGVGYWTLVRPRMLHWGATPAEVERTLPGDELLPEPDGESTMAISIDAPPEAVWPWLRQLGQDRGGFYSYEWAENLVGLGIHNADEIVPEYQDRSVGDTVWLGRADRFPDTRLEVASLSPERALVLRSPGEHPWWIWSFVLEPVGGTGTRLLVRSRISLPRNPVVRFASQSVLDPVTFVMTRGMLLGIRSRVESTSHTAVEGSADDSDAERARSDRRGERA
jgi:hypothetical protein